MNLSKSRFDFTNLIIMFRGLLVGLLTGIVVGLFRLLIEKSLELWKVVYGLCHQQPLYLLLVLAVVVLLGVFIGFLVKQQPHISGSGIPEVEIQLLGQLDLKWWSILWRKFVGGVLAIGSGLFLGREGPSIQLGSSIGQGMAESLKTSKTDRRVLIASGAASGLAAAFNAPIAGTMFVLEEVFHNFSPRVWMCALSGALSANFITSNFFGLTPVLSIHGANSFPLQSYWHLIILGIFLGLMGLVYQKVLLFMPRIYAKIRVLPAQFDGILPFVLLIPIGYFWTAYIGGGNTIILSIDNIAPVIWLVAAIFVLRFVFSMISYGSGLPGGIFLPILTLGALLGYLYGVTMSGFGLLPKSLIINLVIFSMAGYFAGIGKAPFTAILLITEMVGNLSHLMPLAVVSLVSYLVVDLLGGAPIYESLADRMIAKTATVKGQGPTDQVTMTVFEDSNLVDREIRDINWPDDTLVTSVRRGEKVLIPTGNFVIRVGDLVTLAVPENRRGEVRKHDFGAE